MSTGKPSAMKGSPSARKGHKRQNCVRISLIPTMLGPPTRSPSPCMNDIEEESPSSTAEKIPGIGLGFSGTRSLPRPPRTSIFAPDLKANTTSIRAPLTPTSPTLPMANYDHGPLGSLAVTQGCYIPTGLNGKEGNRLSETSIFSIPIFPSPCRNTISRPGTSPPPPTFELTGHLTGYNTRFDSSDAVAGASSPFEMLLDIRVTPGKPLLIDEYDPEQPQLVFQTPTASFKRFPSTFSVIQEEPSSRSNGTPAYEQLRSEDSPPCSPKTILPPSFPAHGGPSTYDLPIKDTTIPEEPLDMIDPGILSKEAFDSLNCPFDSKNGGIMKTPDSSRSSIPFPTSPTSAKSMLEPLLEAAFPSSPPRATNTPSSPSIKRARSATQFGTSPPVFSLQSSPTSIYSLPSPSSPPFPFPPSSPLPRFAQLPTPALNFADMPTLSPLPSGPRVSPPWPLRFSIQKLRRMNSDAEKGGKGERRYLRLGREDSIALPGEESWLDELDGGDAWGEEKSMHLVGDLLNDCEEEGPQLGLETDTTAAPPTTASAAPEPPIAEPKDLLEASNPPPPPDRSSSLWEQGKNFWTSTPPYPPPYSPNKPHQLFQPLASSPPPPAPAARKRLFEVAKDEDAGAGAAPAQENGGVGARRRGAAGSRYRKRSALGVGTPNVRIQVQPPSSGGVGGTPGSLYDAEGFLRV